MTITPHCFTLQILFYHVFRSILEKKSWVLVSNFFVKNYPAPKKLTLWRVYVKFSNQTCFVVCTGCQSSTNTHKNGHYLCMFLNAGFQNLGKLNIGFDVILTSLLNGKNVLLAHLSRRLTGELIG